MGIVGGVVGYGVLKLLARASGESQRMAGDAYAERSKLDVLLGADRVGQIAGKTVVDFGCGLGVEAIEMARRGAARVIGLDVHEPSLREARRRAARAGVGDRCEFTSSPPERADLIVTLDSFEHFDDPPAVLGAMARMLAPGGRVIASFGPVWYHPLGGHLLSVVPWAHLVFTERALMRWRADVRSDGATRFLECGLNQMTVRGFRRFVKQSPLSFDEFEAVPIRRLAPLANRLTREFTTSVVRCTLIPRCVPSMAAAG